MRRTWEDILWIPSLIGNDSLLLLQSVNRKCSTIYNTLVGKEVANRSRFRYRPDVPFRHITEELGFENDAECEAFIVKHNAGNFIKTKESAKEDGTNKIVLETAKALPTIEAAKSAAFKKVDIKGQI